MAAARRYKEQVAGLRAKMAQEAVAWRVGASASNARADAEAAAREELTMQLIRLQVPFLRRALLLHVPTGPTSSSWAAFLSLPDICSLMLSFVFLRVLGICTCACDSTSCVFSQFNSPTPLAVPQADHVPHFVSHGHKCRTSSV